MKAPSGKPTLVVREVGSETIVYDPRTHRAHCLGETAAAVWRECDGGRSASEIAERLRLLRRGADRRGVGRGGAAPARAGRARRRAGVTDRGEPEGKGPRARGRASSGPAPRRGPGRPDRSLPRRAHARGGGGDVHQAGPSDVPEKRGMLPHQSRPPRPAVSTRVFFGNRCLPTGVGTCLP